MAVNDLDAKTRAVERMKAEPGKEMAAYQAAENQLLAIRAEQKQNLAMARQEGAAAIAQNATIGQAATLAASSGGGTAVQAPVNAATQNVLAKYGAGPTISKSTQRSSQQVTKQNITINNYTTTTNTTTNNIPNTGPVQGRQVVVNKDDTGRFKVWVNNALARQNEQAAIRDKEYQKRESVLTRSANKMTRKLEAISNNISKTLDPRRQATTFGEQIKRLLKLVGIGVIASNWPKMLDVIGNIEIKIRTFLNYVGITGREERKRSGQETGLVRDIKYILLGKDYRDVKGENGGLFGAIREFFTGERGLLKTIRKSLKLWLENRGKAIKAINPPNDFSLFSIGDSIKSLINYLGQVFGVLLAGPSGAVKQAAEKAREEGAKEMTTDKNIYHKKSGIKTEDGKHISYGDAAYAIHDVDSANAKYHVMKEDLKEDGSLKNNMGASLRQSAYLADNFTGGKATGGAINVSGIIEGLSRLEKTAQDSKNKTTLVDPKFIEALEKLGVNIESLNLKDKLKEYGYIPRKKTEDEKAEEFAQNSGLANAIGWAGGITSAALTGLFGGSAGLKVLNTAAGAYTGKEMKKLAEQWAQAKLGEDQVFELAPKGKYKDERYANLNQGAGTKKYFNYYELTSEDMKEIKSQLGKLTGRNEEFSYDAADIASTRAMADLLLKKAGPNAKLSDSYASNLQELLKAEKEYNEYEAAQKEIWDNSFMSGMGQRAKEVGGKVKDGATTGYTKPIDGESNSNKSNNNISSVKNKKHWDIDKAIKTIIGNKKGESTGYCFRHVGNAISAGFGEEKPIKDYNTESDPNMGGITEAKDSGAALVKLGFEVIPNGTTPQRGDIRVYQGGPKHPHGHIEIFDGTNWYSDFKQINSGIKWGYYNGMTAYRWKEGNTDGDIIDSDTTTPTDTTSPSFTWLANAENAVKFSNATMSIPLLANNSGRTITDIAESTAASSTNNGVSTTLIGKMDRLIGVAQNIEGITTLAAESSARNVDATTLVAASVASTKQSPQSTQRLTYLFTPPPNNGSVG